MSHCSQFSISISLQSFTKLEKIPVLGKLRYSIAAIADIKGEMKLFVCGQEFRSDSPVLNLIEVSEFLYALSGDCEEPIALTLDMEPVIYAWRRGETFMITSFNLQDLTFNGHKNVLGELTNQEVAFALSASLEQASKIITCDPSLYLHVINRTYRQQSA